MPYYKTYKKKFRKYNRGTRGKRLAISRFNYGGARMYRGTGIREILGSQKNHYFRRRTYFNITTATGAYAGGNSFSLSDVPASTEFTSLFDQYRINCVVFTIVNRANVRDQLPSPDQTGMPILYYVVDNDDVTAPTRAELQEYSQTKTFYYTADKRACRIKLFPKVTNTVFRTGATSAYAVSMKKQWLDCAYPDIPHYGLKWFLEVPGTTGSTNCTFDVISTYYLQFRTAR